MSSTPPHHNHHHPSPTQADPTDQPLPPESIPASLDHLTRREREVLTLVAHGLSLTEIAQRLHRSQKTIETHRLSLGRKLHANNRVTLARIGIAHGLAPLPPLSPENTPNTPDPWALCEAIAHQLQDATGTAYFTALIELFHNHLHPRIVTACALESGHDAALILAGYFNDQPVQQQHADIRGTPCRQLVEHGRLHLNQDLRQNYPDHPVFSQTDANAYLGVAMQDPAGLPLGYLCLVDNRPLDPRLETVLRLAAQRGSSELLHQRNLDNALERQHGLPN